MERRLNFAPGTEFVYDTESRRLTLTALGGLTCGHNGREDDYSCSGLAVVCADGRRFEGDKLFYGITEQTPAVFRFSASDAGQTVKLEYEWRFEPDFGLISCRGSLTNTSGRPVTVRRVLPRWVFSPGDYEVFWQMSRWGAENQLQHQSLRGADLMLHGRPARSTVGSTPFCILRDNETDSAVAFHVLPRGNWTIQVRSDILSNEFPSPVVEAGLSDTDFFITLSPEEKIVLPEVLIQQIPPREVFQCGAPLQRYMIRRCREARLNRPPVVYNSWLYRFTQFTREQLSRELAAAREIGCEVFIVDAGWFGRGDGWNKVGDWREKEGGPFFGNMAAFADEVRAAGLKFGFWMEPERWAAGIPVRKEHPEWFPDHTTRIDLTQPAAAEYFHDVISENVRRFGAEYIKIDFNASVGYDASGAELHGYCTVLQEELKRLKREFPRLVIENCGSGALRCDLATAQIFDLAFVSDNAHPFETLRIRQGAFMRFPPGRILNWIVLRPAPERLTPVSECTQILACAAATWDEAALFDLDYAMLSGLAGVPGFSGELAELAPGIRKKIAEYVRFYKENRDFFVDSHAYLLTPPDSGVTDYENYLAFQMQGNDSADSLVFVFTNASSRRGVRHFRLFGLDAGTRYRVTEPFGSGAGETILTGEELMCCGLKTEIPENQHVRHAAKLYRVRAVPDAD